MSKPTIKYRIVYFMIPYSVRSEAKRVTDRMVTKYYFEGTSRGMKNYHTAV